MRRKLPVTILTGFLGAGKTTLLRRILEDPGGLRIAVVVNDFGDINIDAELIADASQDAVALTNGCICCTMRNGLLGAVATFLRQPVPPDHVVIEASGISDPRAIAQTFLLDGLENSLSVDCIVAVIDTHAYPDLGFQDGELVLAQIAAADLALLNKTDIAVPDAVATLKRDLEPLAHRLRLIETVDARIPLDLLLGSAPRRSALPACTEAGRPEHGFTSWSWRHDGRLSLVRFEETVASWPRSIYRAKGILHLDAFCGRRGVFQMVGPRASIEAAAPWHERAHNKLIVIGRDLEFDAGGLEEALLACLDPG